jgi:prophage tail gpP-like protein
MGVNELINYGGECEKMPVETKRMEEPTVTENLKMKRAKLEKQLFDINAAIEALESNPGVEKVLNLISKTGRY